MKAQLQDVVGSISMKAQLQDLVRSISNLGLESIKIVSNTEGTSIQSNKKVLIMSGVFLQPVENLNGTFGLTNIPLLAGLINFHKDKDDVLEVINRTTKDEITGETKIIPEELRFKKASGAKTHYRFQSEKHIQKQMDLKAELEYQIVVEQPAKILVDEFAQLTSIFGSYQETFSYKTIDNDLVFLIGDENVADHRAQFVFAKNVSSTMSNPHGYSINIADFLTILKMAEKADCTVKFSDQGVVGIDINTGIGFYQYMLAGSK